MAKIKMNGHTKCWQECGGIRNFHAMLVKIKMLQPFWKTAQQFLKKLNIILIA